MDRIRYVPAADEATVRSIRRGILYLMAFWSIYSVQAFARLTEVLARLDTEELELVVVDVDDLPGLASFPQLGKRLYAGAGETAWVHDGQIVTMSALGVDAACLEPNTIALLSLP